MSRAEREDRFLGGLLGGAVGDTLGALVEFESLAAIRSRFGPDGITAFAPAYGKLGAITEDTQMAWWTAEGLLRMQAAAKCGPVAVPLLVRRAATAPVGAAN